MNILLTFVQIWEEWNSGLDGKQSLRDKEAQTRGEWRKGLNKQQWNVHWTIVNLLQTVDGFSMKAHPHGRRPMNGGQAAIHLEQLIRAEAEPTRDKYYRWILANRHVFLAQIQGLEIPGGWTYVPVKELRKPNKVSECHNYYFIHTLTNITYCMAYHLIGSRNCEAFQ